MRLAFCILIGGLAAALATFEGPKLDPKPSDSTVPKDPRELLLESISKKPDSARNPPTPWGTNKKPPKSTQRPPKGPKNLKMNPEPAPPRNGGRGLGSSQGGGGKPKPTPAGGGTQNIVKPNFWIPFCFLIYPEQDPNEANEWIRAIVRSYATCDIAVEPYPFRVKYMPEDPGELSSLAKAACPLNDVFKVEGSAVQAFHPSTVFSDKMCGEPPENWPQVAGCSELGNKGGMSGSAMSQMGPGNFGGAGAKGVPAFSAVDRNMGPIVACHESGHSVGGPGQGGNFLVNEGEAAKKNMTAPPAGVGLELMVYLRRYNYCAAEGGGLKGECNFTPLGCASLRGGANPNIDKRHIVDMDREYYYYERPEVPPRWELNGQSFFAPSTQLEPPPPMVNTPHPKADPTTSQTRDFFTRPPRKNTPTGETPKGRGHTESPKTAGPSPEPPGPAKVTKRGTEIQEVSGQVPKSRPTGGRGQLIFDVEGEARRQENRNLEEGADDPKGQAAGGKAPGGNLKEGKELPEGKAPGGSLPDGKLPSGNLKDQALPPGQLGTDRMGNGETSPEPDPSSKKPSGRESAPIENYTGSDIIRRREPPAGPKTDPLGTSGEAKPKPDPQNQRGQKRESNVIEYQGPSGRPTAPKGH